MHKTLNTLIILTVCAAGLRAQEAMKFVEAQALPDSGGNDIVLADFDRDGNVDAFIANGFWNRPLPSRVWINDGTGRFHDSGQELGNAKSWSAASGCFDRSGVISVFVANGDWNGGDSSHLWLNEGHARFICSPIAFGRANSSCTAVGDLNGDGDPDIVIGNHPYADGHGGGVEVWFGDGRGSFVKSEQELNRSNAVRRVKLADVDNDGILDMIVLNGNAANKIFLNDGTGHFSDSEQDIGQGENSDVAIGDIDCDGLQDLVLAKGAWGGKPKGIEVWHSDRQGHFTKVQNIGNYDCYGVALTDLDNDGYPDIVAVHGPGQPNQVFLNNKHGKFFAAECAIGEAGNKVAVCDLNHDGLPDIMIVGNGHTRVFLRGK